jgi:hypothetical protein
MCIRRAEFVRQGFHLSQSRCSQLRGLGGIGKLAESNSRLGWIPDGLALALNNESAL